MFDPRLKAGMAAFLVLTGLFTGNLFLFQSSHREMASNRIVFPDSSAESERMSGYTLADTDLPPVNITSKEGSAPGAAPANGWVPAKTGSLPPAAPDADLTRAIQRELQVLGYDAGGVDGVAGVTTRAAIMAFEWDNGLPLSAEPKQDILQSLLMGGTRNGPAGSAEAAPVGPRAKDVIKTVQQSLTDLGMSKSKPNGVLDDATRGAIRRFEAREGMQQTGRISGRMTARLLRLSAEKRVAKS